MPRLHCDASTVGRVRWGGRHSVRCAQAAIARVVTLPARVREEGAHRSPGHVRRRALRLRAVSLRRAHARPPNFGPTCAQRRALATRLRTGSSGTAGSMCQGPVRSARIKGMVQVFRTCAIDASVLRPQSTSCAGAATREATSARSAAVDARLVRLHGLRARRWCALAAVPRAGRALARAREATRTRPARDNAALSLTF